MRSKDWRCSARRFGEVALRRLHSTLAAAPVIFAHAVVTEIGGIINPKLLCLASLIVLMCRLYVPWAQSQFVGKTIHSWIVNFDLNDRVDGIDEQVPGTGFTNVLHVLHDSALTIVKMIHWAPGADKGVVVDVEEMARKWSA